MANLMIDESGSGYTPGSLLKPFYKNVNQGATGTAFGQQFIANEEVPNAPSGFGKIKNKFSDLLSLGKRDQALEVASNAVAEMAGSSAVQAIEKFFSNMLEQHDLFQKANEQDNQKYIGYGQPPLPEPVPPPPKLNEPEIDKDIQKFGNEYENKLLQKNLNRSIK